MSKQAALLPILVLLIVVGGLTTGIGSCVVVQPRSATLEVGETLQLEASGNRDDTFTWATFDPDVATVDQAGLVTAVGVGTTTITATGNTTGSVGRARIRVVEPTGVQVSVTPESGTVAVGDTFDFDATSTDPDDTSFTWSTGDETIATVDGNGTVTGVSEGTTTVTATGVNSGESGTATIEVTQAGAIVTLTALSTSVEVHSTLQLTATSTDPADTSFTFTSSDESVATVDSNGLVTGVSPGPVTITATGSSSGASDTIDLTVVEEGGEAPVANAGPDQTVGTNTPVTLDGTGSTGPAGATLTFLWTQTAGPEVTLSDPTAAEPTFTPPQPGTYEFSLVVSANGVDSEPDTVTITVENQAPTVRIEIDAISEADIERAALLTGPSSGLNTVGVGEDVYLTAVASDPDNDAIASYMWVIVSAPPGSTAALSDTTTASTMFIPDLEGTYEIGVIVEDEFGAQTEVFTQVIHATFYVGAGIVAVSEGVATLSVSTCTGCHSGILAPDNFTPWLTTAHATAFQRFVDAETELLDFCTSNALRVITVGYHEYADNDGFDDIAVETEFTLPTPAPGTYDGLLTTAAGDLMRLANVQCENCHGPAGLHPANALAEDKHISVSLDSGACGQCHSQEREWEVSGHANAESEAFTFPIGPTRTACVKCHSGLAFIDFSEGDASLRTDMQTHTCAVCHDPHDSAQNPAQVRIANSATLPGDLVLNDLGSSATCITCHNGRMAPANALSNGFPHYSTASENVLAVNAIDYDKYVFPSSPHNQVAHPVTEQTLCAMCHMAPTPGGPCEDDVVGGHTFAVSTDSGTPGDTTDDVVNLANACQVCHPSLTSLERTAAADYDGDGATESVQDEVGGLLAVLLAALETSGVEHVSHHPYWQGVTTDAQRQAIYNFELVNHDGSGGIHNTRFSVAVLQATYREFTGADVPGATIVYQLQSTRR